MLIIIQTFTEDSEATILCLNSLLKEVGSSDAERRVNGLKLMSSIANNDIYPFIYSHIQKGMNDLNPFVRRAAYAGLLKLRNICEFSSTQNFVPDGDESGTDEEEAENEDLCLRLLRNTLHNVSELEQEVGGQSIRPEENENILSIALYLLDSVIDEEKH
jgi:vesicle coat complex subunit